MTNYAKHRAGFLSSVRTCPVCFKPVGKDGYRLPLKEARDGVLILHHHCWESRLPDEQTAKAQDR